MKQEMKRLESEIREALDKMQQSDNQEEGQISLFPESTNIEVQDRQMRRKEIQSLKELEKRKPEAESKTAAKDQINFTDSESRIMDTKTQGVIQGYNPQSLWTPTMASS